MTQVNRQAQLRAESFLGTAADHATNLETGRLAPPKLQRRRIWELPGHYHCSVIGTCLTTGELRKLLGKLGMAAPAESDHDLHGRGVSLAARPDLAGKLLNKALDDRHQVALKRYARAKSPEVLQALWREDAKSGDIPGGYWAVLTHPASGHDLLREAFGYVHMLSHLVGAANRADIRRLQALEAQNAALAQTAERQQAKIRDMALECRATAQTLRDAFLRQATAPDAQAGTSEAAGLRQVIADMRRQLEGETRRRIAADARLARAQTEIAEARTAASQAERRAQTLQAEIEAVERSLAVRYAGSAVGAPAPQIDLGGKTLLYVGGRPAQLPHLREAAAARGAALLHHDGGIEDNDLTLASLVNRADLVLFPVDCVSHAAAGTVKRTCRNAGKTYLPLRSAAVTSFIAALSG